MCYQRVTVLRRCTEIEKYCRFDGALILLDILVRVIHNYQLMPEEWRKMRLADFGN